LKPGLEKNTTDRILKWLKDLGPECKALKRHMNEMTEAGNPDIEGCFRGRHFEIEVKKPGAYTQAGRRTLQSIRADEWDAAGALMLRDVTSLEEVSAAFTQHLGYAANGTLPVTVHANPTVSGKLRGIK
jgi:hypothetical protein